MWSKDRIFLFLLFLLTVVIVSPFFSPGFPNTHDGQTHVVRLAAFHQALFDGQFPPRWAGNLALGFGSPVLSLNFPLPYWLGETIHLAGLSFEDSVKGVFVIGTVFSGIMMYEFLRQTFTSSVSFLGGAFYLLTSYRFLDLYVRGEIGESLIFIFPPLILLVLSKLKEKISWAKIFLGAVMVCLMILSHQSLAFAFLTIIVFYSLIIFYPKRKPIAILVLIIILGMALAAFNLFPLIFERQYTNLDRLIQTNYHNQFPTISSLFYSKWSWGPADTGNPDISMSFQLGIGQWLGVGVLAAILFLRFLKRKTSFFATYRRELFVLTLFMVFLFLISPYSRFLWDSLPFLPPFLYPWRLLGVLTFLAAVISALAIALVENKPAKILLFVSLLFLAFYANRNHLQIVGRDYHPDSFYSNFSGTSDMGGEFLPRWANLEKLKTQKKPPPKIEFSDDEIKAEKLNVKSNKIGFTALAKKETTVTVNTFYFPGWTLYIDGKEISLDGKISKETGLINFFFPPGRHSVILEFKETPMRKAGNAISALTLLGLTISLLFQKFLTMKKRIDK